MRRQHEIALDIQPPLEADEALALVVFGGEMTNRIVTLDEATRLVDAIGEGPAAPPPDPRDAELETLRKRVGEMEAAGDRILTLMSRCSDQATDGQKIEHKRNITAMWGIWNEARALSGGRGG